MSELLTEREQQFLKEALFLLVQQTEYQVKDRVISYKKASVILAVLGSIHLKLGIDQCD